MVPALRRACEYVTDLCNHSSHVYVFDDACICHCASLVDHPCYDYLMTCLSQIFRYNHSPWSELER